MKPAVGLTQLRVERACRRGRAWPSFWGDREPQQEATVGRHALGEGRAHGAARGSAAVQALPTTTLTCDTPP